MGEVRDFYDRVWEEYADPESHPVVARALDLQTAALGKRLAGRSLRRILDLGCGPRPAVRPEWAALTVYGDIVTAMLADLKRKLGGSPVCLDARALPFSERAFELVWCSLLVDHVADVRAWANELMRVLEPGGTLGMTCWDQSILPPELYPAGEMLYPTSGGEVLRAPVHRNWDKAQRILRELDPGMRLESHVIVEGSYVLQIAWAERRSEVTA